jgi:hypothetical protein
MLATEAASTSLLDNVSLELSLNDKIDDAITTNKVDTPLLIRKREIPQWMTELKQLETERLRNPFNG